MMARLSPRQAEVVQGIIDGKTNKEIADGLGISEHTVVVHRTAAYARLDVHSVVQLLKMAAEYGRLGVRRKRTNKGYVRDE